MKFASGDLHFTMDSFIPNPVIAKTMKIHPGRVFDHGGSTLRDIHPAHCWIRQQLKFDPGQEQTHNYIFVE